MRGILEKIWEDGNRIGRQLAKYGARCFLLLWLIVPLEVDGGGVPDDGLTIEQRNALALIEKEHPQLHREVLLLIKEDATLRVEVLDAVVEISEEYWKYEEMKPELAAIYMTIKRREFENQVLAEELLRATKANERERVFKKLKDHMDVTFDLNLKLVRGELAWLEDEVGRIRDVVREEQENKQRYIKEDLAALFLDNEPLLQVTIPSLGQSQNANLKETLSTLIDKLPGPAISQPDNGQSKNSGGRD